MIVVKCQGCGENIEVPSSLAGQSEACPACGQSVTIPKEAGTGSAEAPFVSKAAPAVAPSRKSRLPLVLGVCGGVAALAVVGIILFVGGKKPERTESGSPQGGQVAEVSAGKMPVNPDTGVSSSTSSGTSQGEEVAKADISPVAVPVRSASPRKESVENHTVASSPARASRPSPTAVRVRFAVVPANVPLGIATIDQVRESIMRTLAWRALLGSRSDPGADYGASFRAANQRAMVPFDETYLEPGEYILAIQANDQAQNRDELVGETFRQSTESLALFCGSQVQTNNASTVRSIRVMRRIVISRVPEQLVAVNMLPVTLSPKEALAKYPKKDSFLVDAKATQLTLAKRGVNEDDLVTIISALRQGGSVFVRQATGGFLVEVTGNGGIRIVDSGSMKEAGAVR